MIRSLVALENVPRLAEAREHSAELHELLHSLKVVPVSALLGAGALQNVAEQGRVADLLPG